MRSYLFVALTIAIGGTAYAQTTSEDAVTSMTKCRTVSDPAARLACFDEAAAVVEAAREKKELVVLDAGEVKKTRRSLFGFAMPRIKFLEGDGQSEVEAEIATTVESARALGYGKWLIRTAEGASWQTTEAMSETPSSGAKVVIRRASLGSYFLKVDRARAVRAKRTG